MARQLNEWFGMKRKLTKNRVTQVDVFLAFLLIVALLAELTILGPKSPRRFSPPHQ
jgi:hypothetical protein